MLLVSDIIHISMGTGVTCSYRVRQGASTSAGCTGWLRRRLTWSRRCTACQRASMMTWTRPSSSSWPNFEVSSAASEGIGELLRLDCLWQVLVLTAHFGTSASTCVGVPNALPWVSPRHSEGRIAATSAALSQKRMVARMKLRVFARKGRTSKMDGAPAGLQLPVSLRAW